MRLIRYILLLTITIFIAGCESNGILNPSENLTSVPVMEMRILPDDYSNLLSNKTTNLEVPCRIFYKDEIYTALVRASGSGSRYHDKWGFRISLQQNEMIEGYRQFNLSSQTFDKTGVITPVALQLYKQAGLYTHQSQHIFLKINDEDIGLYPIIERVDEQFFEKRNLKVYELFKLSFEAKFTFRELNNPIYNFDKEYPDDENFLNLYEFIYALDTTAAEKIPSELSKYLDIDNYLKYHALTSLLRNYDAFTNNFFLLKETPNSPFRIIPWDFDKCFSPPFDAELVGENEIIQSLFRNDSLFNSYKQIVSNFLDNEFSEANIFPIIDSTAAIIKDAYNLDPYLGKGRYIFDHEIINLKQYISARIIYARNNINNISRD